MFMVLWIFCYLLMLSYEITKLKSRGVYLKFVSWSFGKKSTLKVFQCTCREGISETFQSLNSNLKFQIFNYRARWKDFRERISFSVENVNQFQNLDTRKRKKIIHRIKYHEALQFQTHEIFSSIRKEAIGQALSFLECCFYTHIKFFNFFSNQTRNPTNNVPCWNVFLNPRKF